MSRILAIALSLTMVLDLLAGCGGGGDSTGGSGDSAGGGSSTSDSSGGGDSSGGAAKDTLIIATANETPKVNTYGHNAVAGDYINKMTHNSLFYVAEDMSVQPDLVDSYEIVSDTEWVFHLKQGVKFHNGTEMTAKDVKASLELCKVSPDVETYGKSSGTIEVVDDYTVKMITDGPQSGLLADLCHHGNAILPADLIESGHDFNAEPIGTGPYKLVKWNTGESLEFEAFADYFKGEAPIKHVIWKIIPEGSSRTMALEAGEVDLIVEVETTDISRMQDNSKITVYSEAGTSHNFMMINNEKAPFDNINFRRAIDAAIDKAAVVQVAFNGAASPVDAMIPDCFPGTTADNAPSYDPEAAKAYFADSGLNAADCGFTIICSNDTKLRAGQVIQDNLKQNLGIDVTLESMDLATYLTATAEGNYEAAIGGYTADTLLSYAKGVYHSENINASNKTRTDLPEIDAAIEAIQATIDPEENEKLITEFCLLINDNCPQVPIWMENNTRAYNANLKGFNVTAGGVTHYEWMSW